MMTPTSRIFSTEIGKLADSVKGSEKRTSISVAGRTMEEMVELCLAAGMTTGEIYEHVNDAIFNQFLKSSRTRGDIHYPSEPMMDVDLEHRTDLIADEIADVSIMLQDLAHVSNVNIDHAVAFKTQIFKDKIESGQFYANSSGNLYVRKPHMVMK